jgi:NAD(P)-dependent dehydrogenase (short-subunit alcohol dehydrogenase family)
MKLRGIGALITGGSRGLGAALGGELAGRGARVGLVGRDEAKLNEVVSAIRARGGDAHAILGDLGKKEDTHKISGAAAALLGDIELLVHNGGTLGPSPLPALLDADCESLEEVLAVNVLGPFRLGKTMLGPMLLRGRGLVVHVSSDAAIESYPGWGLYGASKAAFDQLSRVWAAELAGSGVRMFAVDPGEMNTAMHAAAVPDADPKALAAPIDVARAIAAMITDDTIGTGSRLSVPTWRPNLQPALPQRPRGSRAER